MRLITIMILSVTACMAAETNVPAYKLAKYYPNGQIQSGALWTNGAPTRTFLEWYPNGQMKSEIEMRPRSSEAHGWRTEWDEDGFLKSKVLYREGKVVRIIRFHGKSNTPESVQDMLIDSYITYYPSGILRSERTNPDGPGVGRSLKWYEDGKQKRAWHYLDGKPHGLCLQWHPNGQKMEERVYEFGEPKGLPKYWNGAGKPAPHPDIDVGG